MDASADSCRPAKVLAASAWNRSLLASPYSNDWRPSHLAACRPLHAVATATTASIATSTTSTSSCQRPRCAPGVSCSLSLCATSTFMPSGIAGLLSALRGGVPAPRRSHRLACLAASAGTGACPAYALVGYDD